MVDVENVAYFVLFIRMSDEGVRGEASFHFGMRTIDPFYVDS